MLDPKILKPGEEQFEEFGGPKNKGYVQYDYRHTNGELFSCVSSTLGLCRMRRDAWLNKQN